jgi:hypothetical protein
VDGEEWVVLGFDARERWCPQDRIFPPDRIDRFLLRADVEKALSADVAVWPTIFVNADVGHLGLEDLDLGKNGVLFEGWSGGLQGLFASLPDLLERVAVPPPEPSRPFDIVAFTAPEHPQPALGATDPSDLDPGWQLRGYDIVDPWLLSGLSNCGFMDRESGRLRARWAPHLNRWHLFESLDEARAFCEVSDARVPEHAPFIPCGIQVLGGEDPTSPRL